MSTTRPQLADRVAAARDAGFVGRRAELELFRSALAGGSTRPLRQVA